MMTYELLRSTIEGEALRRGWTVVPRVQPEIGPDDVTVSLLKEKAMIMGSISIPGMWIRSYTDERMQSLIQYEFSCLAKSAKSIKRKQE